MLMAEAVHANPEVALEVHAREELGVDPDATGDPIAAAVSSFAAFSIGAFIPLVPWLFTNGTATLVLSILLALAAAAAVGYALAYFTGKSKVRTMARQVILGSAACLLTFLIGSLLGTAVS